MPFNMSDREIQSFLGEKRGDRFGCPICGARRGVSLTRKDGKVLLYCHANQCDVWSLLRKRGTPNRVQPIVSDEQDGVADRIRDAEAIEKSRNPSLPATDNQDDQQTTRPQIIERVSIRLVGRYLLPSSSRRIIS
jgi:hypothetical protein